MSYITRNFFEKYFYPKNVDIEDYKKYISVPPKNSPTSISFENYTIKGPTVFVAGRYRKLSRDLSQTPWHIDNKRMKENSIQELISFELCPHFVADSSSVENCLFMASGREDIDVRMLSRGRPFIVQITDSKICSLPLSIAGEIQSRIDNTKLISVQDLQMVTREELKYLKMGEEQKKKFYRALCVLKTPANVELIKRLDIPNGFLVQQQTPLRVVHRRPLLTRPRQIFSLKGFITKGILKDLIK